MVVVQWDYLVVEGVEDHPSQEGEEEVEDHHPYQVVGVEVVVHQAWEVEEDQVNLA